MKWGWMLVCLIGLFTDREVMATCADNDCPTGSVTLDIQDDGGNSKMLFCVDDTVILVADPACSVFDLTQGVTCRWEVDGEVLAETGTTASSSPLSGGVKSVTVCVDGKDANGRPSAVRPVALSPL